MWRLFLLVALTLGCARGRPAADATFERVQEDEARLDRALHAAFEGPCSDACDAPSKAQEAAEALCGRASGDADVEARCRAARREAEGAAAGAARCACGTQGAGREDD